MTPVMSLNSSNKFFNDFFSLMSNSIKIGSLPVIFFIPSKTSLLEFSRLSKQIISKSFSRARAVT